MKKLLVLSLVLLLGVTGFAKTNYFDNIYVGGTSTLTGAMTFTGAASFASTIEVTGLATLTAGVDSAGICDFQYSPLTGTVNGHILKTTLTTATAYSGTTAGLLVKNYFADTGTTITGGEFTGLYVNVKQLAALAGGGKSSIISGHNYGSGGDYQYLDYGMILYGDLTWGIVLSGGTSTYGIYMADQTISTADILLSNGETISNVVDGDVTVSGDLGCTVPGSYDALLASVEVDVEPVATTALYTVPTGSSCVITRIVIRSANKSLDQGTDATSNIGFGAATDLVASADISKVLTGTTTWDLLTLATPGVIGTTTQVLNWHNTTGCTTADSTLQVDVFGYLF